VDQTASVWVSIVLHALAQASTATVALVRALLVRLLEAEPAAEVML
jgi:hypothetical protein